MFMPPQQESPAEIKAKEQAANRGVKEVIATCVLLYLSPFAVEYVKKLI